jgi:tetraacyldisaccharide 4'-kinase
VQRPSRAIGFCGIGRPASFRRSLTELRVELAAFEVFGDHHRYSRDEVERLQDSARRAGAALVTTEKDLARLGDLSGGAGPPLVALRIEAEPFEPAPLLDRVVELVEGYRA